MSKIFVGIDLGGTNVKIGCFDDGLKLICKTSVATEADMGEKGVVERVSQTITKMLKDIKLSLNDVAGIGIGTPGPADYKAGILHKLANLPKFKDVPLRRMLSDSLGKPAVMENDAKTACWGEFVCGAGKKVNDMVFFTFGTGIGCGIIIDRKLVRGSTGNASEVGHTIIYPDGRKCGCGQKGCFEAYASASYTAKRATEAVKAGEASSLSKIFDEKGEITAKDVYEHLFAGDKLAKRITDETAKAIAICCVNMLHTTDPERIVFAGGMIAAGDGFLNRVKEYFNEQIWTLKKETVEIRFAALGEDTGIIGAAALAKEADKNIFEK